MSQAARLAHWVPTYSPAVGDVVVTTAAPNSNNVVATSFGTAGGGTGPAAGGRLNVKDFGAAGDGSTDDTAAMQAAHNTGRLIYYPPGNYLFSTITIASGGIVGDGPAAAGGPTNSTRLLTSDNSGADAIAFTGSNSIPLFRDFSLQPSTGITRNGTGIAIRPASGETQLAKFDNIYILNNSTCLHFVRASNWGVTNSTFIGYSVAGILVENLNNADSGDSAIANCLIGGQAGLGTGVLQYSAGGLKITGCKFLGGDTGYAFESKGGASTGILLFSNNSVEQMQGFGLSFKRTSGSSSFSYVAILGNEISAPNVGIHVDASGAFGNFTVTGNIIITGQPSAKGVWLESGSIYTITANNIIGSASTDFGILTTGIANARIGGNLITGCATPTSLGGTSISTADPATVAPLMDGVAAVGTATKYAREDHVHPTDTSRVAKAGDTMAGALTVNGGITASGAGGAGPTITSIDSRGSGATIVMAANFSGLGAPGLYSVGAFPLQFGTNTALAGYVAADKGLVWGVPTGASKGAGTINAVTVYDDNVVLTCMGVQHLKYGHVDLAQWDAVSPTGRHPLAHEFVAMLDGGFDPRDPRQFIARMLENEALPGMPGFKEWRQNEMSVGEMVNRLWLSLELLASAFAAAYGASKPPPVDIKPRKR